MAFCRNQEVNVGKTSIKAQSSFSNDENDRENFKATKNLVNYKIRDNKQQYYNCLFQNNECRTKDTWNGINSLLGKTRNSTNSTLS